MDSGRTFEDHEFKKSSESRGSRKVCVEVAIRPDVVGVRDSKDPGKATLVFTKEEWHAFIKGVKQNEFDV